MSQRFEVTAGRVAHSSASPRVHSAPSLLSYLFTPRPLPPTLLPSSLSSQGARTLAFILLLRFTWKSSSRKRNRGNNRLRSWGATEGTIIRTAGGKDRGREGVLRDCEHGATAAHPSEDERYNPALLLAKIGNDALGGRRPRFPFPREQRSVLRFAPLPALRIRAEEQPMVRGIGA
ncbi:hypothetical protein ALC56_06727 [Trachymyrmex septentrionalis]|uniref:Uncharacterized protein n=1 Tax=Trachymyrmex septentrionalis TaxID=34720 RepID=A0A195FE98_9HYME|nr:hypothetical protein ALC56_06727 [Trachymyrmex septentrionalis]